MSRYFVVSCGQRTKKMKRISLGLIIVLSLAMGPPTAAVALDYRALKEACDSFDAKRCDKQMRETDPVTLFFYGKDEVGKKNIFVSTAAICISAEMGFGDGLEECLRKASTGNSVAQFHIGAMYATGIGLEPDPETAFMWLIISAQKGHTPAIKIRDEVGVTLDKTTRMHASERSKICIKSKYQDCKKAENRKSTQVIGAKVFKDKDTPTEATVIKDCTGNSADRLEFCVRHAKRGIELAQFLMGKGLLEEAPDNERSLKEAYVWLTLSANSGYKQSEKLQNSAKKLLRNKGLLEESKQLARACQTSNYRICSDLLLSSYRVIWQTTGKLRKDAEAGISIAMLLYADKNFHGIGVLQDYKEAAKWYLLAAQTDEPDAQLMLGLMHKEGLGVEQNFREAFRWIRMGAEQQNKHSAQNDVGFMYAKGQGTIKDSVMAHVWFNIAASNGSSTGMKNRDIIAENMTPSQIAEAQKLARECIAREYKGC